MQGDEKAVSELATILARGYLRHRKARRLDADPGCQDVHVPQLPDSEHVTEKPLDCPGHQSGHALTG